MNTESAAQHVVRFGASAHAYVSPRWEPALKLLRAEHDRVSSTLPAQPAPPGMADSAAAGRPARSPLDTLSNPDSRAGSQGPRGSPYPAGSPGEVQLPLGVASAALDPRMQTLPGRLGPGKLGGVQSQAGQGSQQGQHAQQLQQGPGYPGAQHPQHQQGQQLPQGQSHQRHQQGQQGQQGLTPSQLGGVAPGNRTVAIDLTDAAGSPAAAPAPSYAGASQGHATTCCTGTAGSQGMVSVDACTAEDQTLPQSHSMYLTDLYLLRSTQATVMLPSSTLLSRAKLHLLRSTC